MDKRSPPKFSSSLYAPRYWSTWISLGFFRLLAITPLPLGLAFGRLLGDLFYYFARSRRHIAEVNIAKCFPQLSADEQRKLVRKIMHSTGKSIVETAVALWGPDRQLKPRYSIHGIEHIHAAQATGRGILLIGGHFTTLDLAGRIMSFHFKCDMLYRKDANELIAYAMASARERYAGNAIVRSDTRQLIKNLRQGNIVWYAPDQDYGTKYSVFAPFFGVQAATMVATARIAQLGQAVAVPFSHYRDENNHYHIVIEPALEDYPTGDDVIDATRINQVIETAVAKHPDQYLWVHRRFKNRPEGEASFYKKKK